MAHTLAQKKSTRTYGNTNKVRNKLPSKGRNWVFTLNNYTKKDIGTFFDLKLMQNLKSFCFQEEMGENGTPHLQGVLAYKNAISFNSVKKIHPLAHWEKCKNLKASLQYCSKADTRIGRTYTWNYQIFNEGIPLTSYNILQDLMKQNLADPPDLTGINL